MAAQVSPLSASDCMAAAALSAGEERFDAIRRTVGLFLGPVALAIVLVWPMPGLSDQAHRLAAVVALIVVWWVTEAIPIPITALVGTVLTVLFGVADTTEAFAPYADPLITELTSNTAATNMLVPVVISICSVAGVNLVAPAIGTCLGASLGFMLPIGTPSNAIVYGTGLVPIRSMIRFGFVMDVLGYVVILVGLWILCPMLGIK